MKNTGTLCLYQDNIERWHSDKQLGLLLSVNHHIPTEIPTIWEPTYHANEHNNFKITFLSFIMKGNNTKSIKKNDKSFDLIPLSI